MAAANVRGGKGGPGHPPGPGRPLTTSEKAEAPGLTDKRDRGLQREEVSQMDTLDAEIPTIAPELLEHYLWRWHDHARIEAHGRYDVLIVNGTPMFRAVPVRAVTP